MSARAGAEITLCGPPHSTSAVVRLDAVERSVPITLKIGDGLAGYNAQIKQFAQGTSEIRLRLPRYTPPGVYAGEGEFGGTRRGVAVEVRPELQLRIHPKRSSITVQPGSGTPFSIEITNGGNVPFEIPELNEFDLDAIEEPHGALGERLLAALDPNEQRVDRFFEEIGVDHDGEARVAVRSGAGWLPPAESRTLVCVIEVSAQVQAGRSYIGAWPIGNTAHVIAIEATPPKSAGESS